MVLKVLGNWSYKPDFTNGEMEVVFRRLSAREELAIIEKGGESRIEIFLASIVEIKEPLQLETDKGLRDMTVQDLVEIPELKPLFYELLQHHNRKTAVSEENVKKR